MDEEKCLDNLKKDFELLRKKYELPEFEKLNQDFSIEKIAQYETEFILREVKRFMTDKFTNYLKSVEAMLQPSNAPMFIFSIVKTLNEEQRKNLSEIYKKLAEIQVDLFELDIEFDEKKDAEFIKSSFNEWNKMKEDLLDFIKYVKNNWNNKNSLGNRSYFS